MLKESRQIPMYVISVLVDVLVDIPTQSEKVSQSVPGLPLGHELEDHPQRHSPCCGMDCGISDAIWEMLPMLCYAVPFRANSTSTLSVFVDRRIERLLD